MSGNIPYRDMKVLCIRSGNRCALPDCRRVLVLNKTAEDKESLLGVMAHIKGERAGAPRYDSKMSDKERNSYGNLILLCANCHKKIDDQPNTYNVERLKEIKNNHEELIINLTKQAIVNITFRELREISLHLLSSQIELDSSYTVIPPKEKIKKNNLSNQIENLIMIGMTQVKRVRDFINANPDIEFGEKLKQGFVIEYIRLKNEEKLEGDELFNRLLDFASGSSNEFNIRAGGLAVLTYLFEKCEVFEK